MVEAPNANISRSYAMNRKAVLVDPLGNVDYCCGVSKSLFIELEVCRCVWKCIGARVNLLLAIEAIQDLPKRCQRSETLREVEVTVCSLDHQWYSKVHTVLVRAEQAQRDEDSLWLKKNYHMTLLPVSFPRPLTRHT